MQTVLQEGQILGGTYQVQRLLGRGGMAEVYAATHIRLARPFALKLLRLDLAQNDSLRRRFVREAEILGQLRHPHIVDVTDWNCTDQGEPYLVMELLEGEDLGCFLRRGGALTAPAALQIIEQVGTALLGAHCVGVIHRDLKPSNIFLCKAAPFAGFIKVLDFGIARWKRFDIRPLTAQEEVVGTPGYMAPEQARGRHDEVDAHADQFALAAILYELLAGRPAFYSPGDSDWVILDRILHDEPAPLASTPPALYQAVLRGLRKRPADRFATLGEFLRAIRGVPMAMPRFSTAGRLANSPRALRISGSAEFRQRRDSLVGILIVAGLAIVVWALVALALWA